MIQHLSALLTVAAVSGAVLGIDVRNGSSKIAELPCGTQLRVTESRNASPPAAVIFLQDRATLNFPSGDGKRTLFVYVDDQLYALFDAVGPLRITIPLSSAGRHKIVTGSAVGLSAQTARSVCKGSPVRRSRSR